MHRSSTGSRSPVSGGRGEHAPADTITPDHTRVILMVGPSQSLADHLTRATRYMPGAWSVLVAPDGTVAGRILAAQPIHAAVIALRPADGGLAFLEWLRRHHPRVSRIAAFSHTDADDAIRASHSAHQYIAPDTPERELGHKMGRTVALQARLGAENLLAFAGSLQRIPSMPRVYAELRSVVSDPDFNLEQIAKVIARDPGLAVKVLQVVNSAFYGLRRPVADVPHAVTLLGTRTVTSLVLGITVHDQFAVLGAAKRAVDEEWQRALEVAESARSIARAESRDPSMAEAAYLSGLLHNVGRLLLAANVSDRFTAIRWPDTRTEIIAIERSAFGAGHPELGALLLGNWGLDDALVEAVAFYADPSRSLGARFSPLTALHLAVASSEADAGMLDERYVTGLGLQVPPVPAA